jgi:hypothetical protein
VVGTFDASSGSSRTFPRPPGAKYAAVLYEDAAGNWGHLASARLP